MKKSISSIVCFLKPSSASYYDIYQHPLPNWSFLLLLVASACWLCQSLLSVVLTGLINCCCSCVSLPSGLGSLWESLIGCLQPSVFLLSAFYLGTQWMPSACFRIKCKRQSYQGKSGTKHENFIFCRSFEYLEEVGSTILLHGLKYLFSHYCRSAPTLVSGGTKLKSGINAQERHINQWRKYVECWKQDIFM